MRGERMADDVNKKLIDKIKKSEFDEAIKEFLINILLFELEHFEESRPRYGDRYDREIKKYASKFGVKEG